MKTIFTILLFLNYVQNLNAQTSYAPVPSTWKFSNGDSSVEMFFKPSQLSAGNTTFNFLLGFHKYILNGVEIENTLPYSHTNYSEGQWSMIIYDFNPANNKADGIIKDLTLNNKRAILLQKTAPAAMSVNIYYLEGVRNNKPYGFTLPRSFNIIKQ